MLGDVSTRPWQRVKAPHVISGFCFLVCLQCFHVSWSRFLLRSLIFISCHNVWKTVTLFSCKNFLNNVSASFSSRSVTVTGHPRTSLSPTPQTYHYTIRNRVRVAIRQMINLFNFIFTHAACATAKYRSHRVSNARGGRLSSTATSLDNTWSPCQGPPFKLKGGVGLRDRKG